MTSDTTALLNYKYIDMDTGSDVVGQYTQGLSAIASLLDRQFAGFARHQIRRPDFAKISFNNTVDTAYCTPGSSCDIIDQNGTSQAARLYLNAMDYYGRCGSAPNTAGTGSSGAGTFCGHKYTPRVPNGAWFGGVDSLFTPAANTNMSQYLYSANGGHSALNRDGAIIRSLNSNPSPCDDGTQDDGTSGHGCRGQWQDITPRGPTGPSGTVAATGYYTAWHVGGPSGATGRHFSIELGKVADFVPGDRAFAQWAQFNGNVYVSRTVCRTPVPAGGWIVPTDNGAAAENATDLDWAEPVRGDSRHANAYWDGCMASAAYCANGTSVGKLCTQDADCTGTGAVCQFPNSTYCAGGSNIYKACVVDADCPSSTCTRNAAGDSLRRAQLWKCTPSGTTPNLKCDSGDWSIVDGGAGFVSDTYLSFGDPTTNGNRTISMVIANGPFLYVGFDNPTTGLQLWRTNNTNPSTEADGWQQVSFSGLTDSNNLPDPTNQIQIFSAVSALDSLGNYFLYVATGRRGYPVSVYRFGNN
jgi:hypothetical protein